MSTSATINTTTATTVPATAAVLPPSNVHQGSSHVRNELQVNANFAATGPHAAAPVAVAANVKPPHHPHPPPTSPIHPHHPHHPYHPLTFTQYGVTNAVHSPYHRYASYYTAGNSNTSANGKINATGDYIQAYDMSRVCFKRDFFIVIKYFLCAIKVRVIPFTSTPAHLFRSHLSTIFHL